jgi:ketosteroid isomerase-like protein
MNDNNMLTMIETIRFSFETRDFKPLVDLFCEDGVYELPFALDENHVRDSGIMAIRERFAHFRDSAWSKAVRIDRVTVKTFPVVDQDAILVQFFISGVRKADGVSFDFPSSVAILRFKGDGIAHYQDYPNVLGINKAAGLLSQFAETLIGDSSGF